MPAAAAPGRGGIQRGLPPAKPVSIPPVHAGLLAGLGHAIGNVATGVQHATSGVGHAVAHPAPLPKGPGSDIQSSGPGYGAARADAFKHTPAYHQAVKDVFNAQPVRQKAVLVDHLLHTPNYFKSPEGAAISEAFHQLPLDQAAALQHFLPHMRGAGDVVSGLTHAALGVGERVGHAAQASLRQMYGGPKQSKAGGAGALGTMFAPQGAAKVGATALKEAPTIIPNTVQGLYALGDTAVHGHFGKALGMVVDPFVKFAEDPVGTFNKAPLNTLMLAGGPETVIGRGAGAIARSGRFGDAAKAFAGTARKDLALGKVGENGARFVESRSYSPNVLTKSAQLAWEKHLRKRGLDPNIARPAPGFLPQSVAHAMNVGVVAKLNRAADEMTGVRQMAGRGERALVTHELLKAAPHRVVANIVAHILQGVIRTPETALADISKEIDRLKANASKARVTGRLSARLQIRDLSRAKDHPELVGEAFKAAEKIRPVIHGQDQIEVAKGLLDYHQGMRSRLFPYAIAHMGARYDFKGAPTEGALAFRDARKAERDAEGRVRVAEQKAARARGERDQARAMNRRRGLTNSGQWQARFDAAHGELQQAKQAFRDARSKRAELQPHAGRRTGPALVHPDGHELKTDEILKHLEDNHVPDPAYVGHYPQKADSFNFYQRYRLARGTAAGHARTGEAFRTGSYDHTYRGLVAQVARKSETITKAELHDNVIDRFGILKPVIREVNGKLQQVGSRAFRNAEEAASYAHAATHDENHNPIPGRLGLAPISLAPRASMHLAGDLQRPHALDHQPGLELDAFKQAMEQGAKPGAENVALIPQIVADRFIKQFEKTGSSRLGKVTQQFRRTVLPYSTHWMLQIGSEAALRGLVAGVFDPRNLRAGRQLMHELTTTREGRAALLETTGATMYGSHRDLGVFNPNQSRAVSIAKAAPITRQLIWMHNHYADGVSAAMAKLEQQSRIMGLGKEGRKALQEFTGSYQAGIGLQARNLALLAEKLKTDPALVARFGREIDNTFGKYNKLSPELRSAVQSVVPFLPWYLNAAKFVLWTLPVKHPVASSLMASLRQTINQDIADGKQLPLNAFAAQQLARISPFGIFNAPANPGIGGVAAELGQTAASTVLPQALGPIFNFSGLNSYGDNALRGPQGDVKAHSPGALSAAFENAIETLVPAASKVREALEGGRPSYDTSTIWSPEPKPGGQAGDLGTVLNRLFNPFYSFERAKKGSASSGRPGNPLLDSSGSGGVAIPGYTGAAGDGVAIPGF